MVPRGVLKPSSWRMIRYINFVRYGLSYWSAGISWDIAWGVAYNIVYGFKCYKKGGGITLAKINIVDTVQLEVPEHQLLLNFNNDSEPEAFLQFMADVKLNDQWDAWVKENRDAWGIGS